MSPCTDVKISADFSAAQKAFDDLSKAFKETGEAFSNAMKDIELAFRTVRDPISGKFSIKVTPTNKRLGVELDSELCIVEPGWKQRDIV